MRTQEEIVERIKVPSKALFDFGKEVLVTFLDFEHALPLLEGEVSEEDWKQCPDREAAIGEMRRYMEFAWGKAEDHRGLSAVRSLQKMEAWLWVLGDDATLSAVEAAPYENYGAPKLRVICEAYAFPIPNSVEIQRMIQGRACSDDCHEGCGT